MVSSLSIASISRTVHCRTRCLVKVSSGLVPRSKQKLDAATKLLDLFCIALPRCCLGLQFRLETFRAGFPRFSHCIGLGFPLQSLICRTTRLACLRKSILLPLQSSLGSSLGCISRLLRPSLGCFSCRLSGQCLLFRLLGCLCQLPLVGCQLLGLDFGLLAPLGLSLGS